MSIKLKINGETREVTADADMVMPVVVRHISAYVRLFVVHQICWRRNHGINDY